MYDVYSGFDTLNDEEFDALMFDLNDDAEFQRDIADEAARDYFENELENDAATQKLAQELTSPEFQAQLHARYQLIVVWDNISSKVKNCDDIIAALNSATIYMMDPSCVQVLIYDWKELKDILNWNR